MLKPHSALHLLVQVCRRRGVECGLVKKNEADAVECSPEVVDALSKAIGDSQQVGACSTLDEKGNWPVYVRVGYSWPVGARAALCKPTGASQQVRRVRVTPCMSSSRHCWREVC